MGQYSSMFSLDLTMSQAEWIMFSFMLKDFSISRVISQRNYLPLIDAVKKNMAIVEAASKQNINSSLPLKFKTTTLTLHILICTYFSYVKKIILRKTKNSYIIFLSKNTITPDIFPVQFFAKRPFYFFTWCER